MNLKDVDCKIEFTPYSHLNLPPLIRYNLLPKRKERMRDVEHAYVV